MPAPSRPSPLSLGAYSASVVRGPDEAGRWYWRIRTGQRYVWRGWATHDEVTAELGRHVGGTARPQGGAATVRDLLELWLGDQEDRRDRQDLAPRSIETWRAVCRAIVRELGDVRTQAVTRDTLEGYVRTRLRPRAPEPRRPGQRGRAPSRSGAPLSVHRELRLLRQAWRWGREHGHVEGEIPAVRVRARPVVERYTPTPDEAAAVVRELEASAPAWTVLAARLLYATGCRLGEVAGARRRDLDVDRAVLHVRGKTGPRDVHISRRLLVELAPLLPADPEAWLLIVRPSSAATDLRRHLVLACEAAGVPRWSAHALRRSATDRLLEGGASAAIESAHLGHSAAIAVRHYASARLSGLRRAADLLDDLGRPPASLDVAWTDEERALVTAAAARHGQSPADWLRRVALAAAQEPPPAPPTRGASRAVRVARR